MLLNLYWTGQISLREVRGLSAVNETARVVVKVADKAARAD